MILDAAGCSAPQIAAERGLVASIEALCADKKVDVNHRTKYNSSETDFGPDETWSALDVAARRGHVDAMKALVAHGGNIIAESDDGFSALHMAADGNNPDAIDFLVQAGLSVEGSKEGWRPLDFAVETYSTEAIQYALLDAGAHPDMGHFDAPLHKAVEKWSSCGESMAKALLGRGANIHHVDDDGDTPLHIAAGRD